MGTSVASTVILGPATKTIDMLYGPNEADADGVALAMVTLYGGVHVVNSRGSEVVEESLTETDSNGGTMKEVARLALMEDSAPAVEPEWTRGVGAGATMVDARIRGDCKRRTWAVALDANEDALGKAPDAVELTTVVVKAEPLALIELVPDETAV